MALFKFYGDFAHVVFFSFWTADTKNPTGSCLCLSVVVFLVSCSVCIEWSGNKIICAIERDFG